MTEWSEQLLIAIAEERLAGLEASLRASMPISNITKACASLHNQMVAEHGQLLAATSEAAVVTKANGVSAGSGVEGEGRVGQVGGGGSGAKDKVGIVNTQFLDMVKVLPQLYKPTQQKLQVTKSSLQTGID